MADRYIEHIALFCCLFAFDGLKEPGKVKFYEIKYIQSMVMAVLVSGEPGAALKVCNLEQFVGYSVQG